MPDLTKTVTAAILCLLAACAVPRQEQLDAAHIGAPPDEPALREFVEQFIRKYTGAGPEVAITVPEPKRGWYKPYREIIELDVWEYGWQVDLELDGKVMPMGHGMPHPWTFWFRNGNKCVAYQCRDFLAAAWGPKKMNVLREPIEFGADTRTATR